MLLFTIPKQSWHLLNNSFTYVHILVSSKSILEWTMFLQPGITRLAVNEKCSLNTHSEKFFLQPITIYYYCCCFLSREGHNCFQNDGKRRTISSRNGPHYHDITGCCRISKNLTGGHPAFFCIVFLSIFLD